MKIKRPFIPFGMLFGIIFSIIATSLVSLALSAEIQQSPQSFDTPEAAMTALIDAADHNDSAALTRLLGPGSEDIASTGSATEDKDRREEFARLAHEKSHLNLDASNPNRATFTVGNQESPFPVPLIHKNGKWMFDTATGRVEILAHRIGRNELDTMQACRGYVEAQLQYADKDHSGDGFLEYAQRLMSNPGKQDGLYWEGPAGSLIPKSFAEAAANYPEGSTKQTPYHGYYFHVLRSQGPDAQGGAFNYVVKGNMIGGFALVAWPAQYGVTGIMTFTVNHLGVVYEKDLGPNSAAIARQLPTFNPDKTWHPVDLE
jgi:hypothetical protein